MTNLQISRNNWLEAKRHDSATEAEASRHNAEMERLQSEANAETARAHRESESISRANLSESVRHSQRSEDISALQLAETSRANLAKEAENIRHNQTSEKTERKIALLTDRREWEKLSQNQQRITVQNAYDLARAQSQRIDNFIQKYYYDAGYYDRQVEKVIAEIDKINSDIDLAWENFRHTEQTDDRKLDIEEKKARYQARKDESQMYVNYFNILNKVFDKLSPLIQDVTGGNTPVT